MEVVMVNVSDFGDQTRGSAPQGFGGFPYCRASFVDHEALVVAASELGDCSHEADQAGRLSVLGAGVTITLASALCWGVLAAIVLALV